MSPSAITGGGANGQVAFWTSTSNLSGNNKLFWDNANGRLGINTTAPAQRLHVQGMIQIGKASDPAGLIIKRSNTQRYVLGVNETTNPGFFLKYEPVGGTAKNLVTVTKDGKVGIGNINPEYSLHIGTPDKPGLQSLFAYMGLPYAGIGVKDFYGTYKHIINLSTDGTLIDGNVGIQTIHIPATLSLKNNSTIGVMSYSSDSRLYFWTKNSYGTGTLNHRF